MEGRGLRVEMEGEEMVRGLDAGGGRGEEYVDW